MNDSDKTIRKISYKNAQMVIEYEQPEGDSTIECKYTSKDKPTPVFLEAWNQSKEFLFEICRFTEEQQKNRYDDVEIGSITLSHPNDKLGITISAVIRYTDTIVGNKVALCINSPHVLVPIDTDTRLQDNWLKHIELLEELAIAYMEGDVDEKQLKL